MHTFPTSCLPNSQPLYYMQTSDLQCSIIQTGIQQQCKPTGVNLLVVCNTATRGHRTQYSPLHEAMRQRVESRGVAALTRSLCLHIWAICSLQHRSSCLPLTPSRLMGKIEYARFYGSPVNAKKGFVSTICSWQCYVRRKSKKVKVTEWQRNRSSKSQAGIMCAFFWSTMIKPKTFN